MSEKASRREERISKFKKFFSGEFGYYKIVPIQKNRPGSIIELRLSTIDPQQTLAEINVSLRKGLDSIDSSIKKNYSATRITDWVIVSDGKEQPYCHADFKI